MNKEIRRECVFVSLCMSQRKDPHRTDSSGYSLGR